MQRREAQDVTLNLMGCLTHIMKIWHGMAPPRDTLRWLTWHPKQQDEVQVVALEALEIHVGRPVPPGREQVLIVRVGCTVVVNLPRVVAVRGDERKVRSSDDVIRFKGPLKHLPPSGGEKPQKHLTVPI